MNLLQWIINEANADDADSDKESASLSDYYASAPAAEQAAIDRAFLHLCGWTLESAIEKVKPMVIRRPVWFPEPDVADSFEEEAEGHRFYGRAPDRIGCYERNAEGQLIWLGDEPIQKEIGS